VILPHLAIVAFLAAVGAILWQGLASAAMRTADRVVATFLLAWAALILSSQVLAVFAALGHRVTYISLTLVIASGIAVGVTPIPLTGRPSFPEFPFPLNDTWRKRLTWYLAATVLLVLLADLVLAYGLLPANPDSIAYRFPRAYWYLSHGTLTHYATSADPRAIFYPVNGTLAYLPLIHFGLGPRSFSLPSLGCWMLIGLTTFLFARDLGGPRPAAFATAWLVCLTPNILVQSLSTNDEIIAAAPLLAGLYFLHRCVASRQVLDGVLAGIGIAISVGTKLHFTFYWPLLGALVIHLGIHRRGDLRSMVLSARRRPALTCAVAFMCAVLGGSFLAWNYASAGRIMDWEFAASLLNKPFRLSTALQNIALYSAQTMLTPFADLHVVTRIEDRAQHYAHFNNVLSPLFAWVRHGPEYVSSTYRFDGIVPAASAAFNENSLFLGFTWIVAIIAAVVLAMPKPGRRGWSRFQLASLAVWLVTFACSTRYIEGVTVYLGYATIVAGPALVHAWSPIGPKKLNLLRNALLFFVIVTHSFFAADMLLTSSPRNFIVLARAAQIPLARGFAFDSAIQEEISRARCGAVHRWTEWEQPFWIFMAYHPEIRHFLSPGPANACPSGPASDDAKTSGDLLEIYEFPQAPIHGFAPVQVPRKATAGLTLIGNVRFTYGPEWVFAKGNGVELRHPGQDDFIVLGFRHVPDAPNEIEIGHIAYGIAPADDLEFRYEALPPAQISTSPSWQRTPRARLAVAEMANAIVSIQVRVAGGDAIAAVELPVRSTKPLDIGSATRSK
jgi:hypothetical protein